MGKLAVPLSLVAVAVLAACASGPRSPASAGMGPVPIATQQVPYRAGTGAVVSVVPAPAMASAGATAAQRAPGATGELYRVGIKMDDGRMQYVDMTGRDIKVGDRVQLTENFEIKKQQ